MLHSAKQLLKVVAAVLYWNIPAGIAVKDQQLSKQAVKSIALVLY
jgi:hypothetical protein